MNNSPLGSEPFTYVHQSSTCLFWNAKFRIRVHHTFSVSGNHRYMGSCPEVLQAPQPVDFPFLKNESSLFCGKIGTNFCKGTFVSWSNDQISVRGYVQSTFWTAYFSYLDVHAHIRIHMVLELETWREWSCVLKNSILLDYPIENRHFKFGWAVVYSTWMS